ncbi:SH3 domain-containing protein [Massilia sp. BHUDP2]|uniref:SH3 domain-containing protein n=1 Tax=Massilia sp. BHUDP2 TaxID=3034505 RepID=UPI003905BF53
MKILICLLMAISPCVGICAFTDELDYSAKSDFSDNPFLAYGYNPKTKVISGYLAAFRTAPGRTDECKLVFKGSSDRLLVKYSEETWASMGGNDSFVSVAMEKNDPYLKFHRESMGGDCDWILPFKVGKRVHVAGGEVFVSAKVPVIGDWIGVYVINSKRAQFHSGPDSNSLKKGYVVKGDVVYVYDEQPEWYFVRYDNGKKSKSGWIKKLDTVQP